MTDSFPKFHPPVNFLYFTLVIGFSMALNYPLAQLISFFCWEMLMAYYVSVLPMDLVHAAATVICILIAAEPMLEKLDRIKVKYGLVE